MTHVLLTGCSATEYSYDTVFGGQANGAASHWLETILRTDPDITYNQMHRRLRARLPSPQCPQSPQLEGPAAMKATKVFGGVK